MSLSETISICKKFLLGNKRWKIISGTVGVCTLALCLRKIYDILYRKLNRYPPGSIGLPFFGHYLWIKRYDHLVNLKQRYGDIFMINVGLSCNVYVMDSKLIKTLLTKDDFSTVGFSSQNDYDNVASNALSIESFTSLNGKEYMQRRQLIHKSFMIILNSKYLTIHLSNIIQQHLFPKYDKYIEQNELKDVNKVLRYDVKYTVFQLIFFAVFGKKYVKIPSEDSKDVKDFFHLTSKAFEQLGLVFFYNMIFGGSFIGRIIRNTLIPTSKRSRDSFMALNNVMLKWVNNFNDNYDKENDDNDDDEDMKPCILLMLDGIKKGIINENGIAADVVTLFMAGVDSTSSKVADCIVWMAKKPKLQKDLYDEISNVMKKYNNDINEIFAKHLNELNIMRAFVMESMRIVANGSLQGATPRTIAKQGLKINEYNIPKGAILYIPYTFQLHDDKYWKNPYQFDLDNYLDENKQFKINIASMEFGVGRRSCPGMQFAKRILYIMLAKLILKYQFIAENGDTDNIKLATWNGDGALRKSLRLQQVKLKQRQ